MVSVPLLLLVLGPAAGGLGYTMGMTQGFLFVGKALTETNSPQGLQNAITPPMLANFSMALALLVLSAIVYAYYAFSIGTGFGAIGIAIISLYIGIKFAPKPDSHQYVIMGYASLVRRHANYARRNDIIRSNAAKDLYERIGQRFPEVFK